MAGFHICVNDLKSMFNYNADGTFTHGLDKTSGQLTVDGDGNLKNVNRHWYNFSKPVQSGSECLQLRQSIIEAFRKEHASEGFLMGLRNQLGIGVDGFASAALDKDGKLIAHQPIERRQLKQILSDFENSAKVLHTVKLSTVDFKSLNDELNKIQPQLKKSDQVLDEGTASRVHMMKLRFATALENFWQHQGQQITFRSDVIINLPKILMTCYNESNFGQNDSAEIGDSVIRQIRDALDNFLVAHLGYPKGEHVIENAIHDACVADMSKSLSEKPFPAGKTNSTKVDNVSQWLNQVCQKLSAPLDSVNNLCSERRRDGEDLQARSKIVDCINAWVKEQIQAQPPSECYSQMKQVLSTKEGRDLCKDKFIELAKKVQWDSPTSKGWFVADVHTEAFKALCRAMGHKIELSDTEWDSIVENPVVSADGIEGSMVS